MKKMRIYLDNNATAPLDPQIAQFLMGHLSTPFGNPSSVHAMGQEARSCIQEARSTIAKFLKVKQQELIFTSGATEGMNMLIQGVMQSRPSGHIITSSCEHAALFFSIEEMEKKGASVTYLSPGSWGAVTPEQVQKAITEKTALITLMAVNNETGVKTDIQAIGEIAKEAQIPFVVDGVALLGKEKWKITPGISALCFSGHKIHAPHGIGLVWKDPQLKISSFLKGGPQEFGLRGGSENLLGILGLAKAFALMEEYLEESVERMEKLRTLFETSLISELPHIFINGEGPRVSNTSNIAFDGVDGEALLIALDQAGVFASHGSACSSGALEPSRILLNMGLPLKRVKESLRFSLSRMTTQKEVEDAVQIIVDLVRKFRKQSLTH